MKVIVLGGGVLGVSTAVSGQGGLRGDGAGAPGRRGFGNQFRQRRPDFPGYSTPWAAPGIPLKAAKWLFQRHAPLAVKPDGGLYQLQWIAKMLANCNEDAYAVNKGRMMRLAEYSRDKMKELRAETGIGYEARQGGTLQLFRSQAQVDGVSRISPCSRSAAWISKCWTGTAAPRWSRRWPASSTS